MNDSTAINFSKAALLIGLSCLASQQAASETVYKCMSGGKINFTSAPGNGQNCQPVELQVVQPNPEEVARELEKKRLREEGDRKEEAKAKADKNERETEAALRRAKSAEDALRLLKETPPLTGNGRSRSWTGLYPHAGGGTSRRFLLQLPQQPPPERVISRPQEQANKP